MESIRGVQVPDGDGGLRPLVMEERQLLDTTRPPVPSRPPDALPWFLLVGVLWGGAILGLSWNGRRLGLPGRLALAVLAGGWTVVAALAGTLLLGAWLFTDHSFWYRNLNLLQVNNTVSYVWVTDIYGRQYAVPNYLTPRQLNIKLVAEF